MPNGLREWTPLDDGEITLGKVWGVLGILQERTRILPRLMTQDQCDLKRAEDREALAEEARDREDRGSSRRYSVLLVLLSSLLSAALAVGGALVLGMGG